MDNETPVELEAPVLGGSEEPSVVTVIQPTISPADQIAAQVGVDAAFKSINAQPREKIRVPKVMGPQVVIINGARFNVPCNIYVEVPEQVAQILRDADRI